MLKEIPCVALAALIITGCSTKETHFMNPIASKPISLSIEEIDSVSPALARYTAVTVEGELWSRPGLSRRDRSIATVSALIAKCQANELPNQINFALDNGVHPSEISEIITHLAFYSGWGNAMCGVTAANQVFSRRGVDRNQLPAAEGALLPLDEATESDRAKRVSSSFSKVAPAVVQNSTDLVFRDLWLRSALSTRDRGLVTVSALIAAGQSAQLPVHLNKAMDNGLTQAEASETLNQLSFYTGWPNVFSAMAVFKDVFDKREATVNPT